MRTSPRLTLSVALTLLVAVAGPTATASSGKAKRLHFFVKETSFKFTAADGSVPKIPPANPKPGDSFDETDVAYVGNHVHHAHTWTGSSHLHCVFATAGKLSCDSQIAIGGSLILTQGDAHIGLKIVGGTGRFLHATGDVTSRVAAGGVDAVVTYRR